MLQGFCGHGKGTYLDVPNTSEDPSVGIHGDGVRADGITVALVDNSSDVVDLAMAEH